MRHSADIDACRMTWLIARLFWNGSVSYRDYLARFGLSREAFREDMRTVYRFHDSLLFYACLMLFGFLCEFNTELR